jgi:hypothetical protein
MTKADRDPLIHKFAALPAQVRAAVAGASDAELDTIYRDGGWTIRQVVHHLADSHIHAFCRVRFILTESNPAVKPYGQDAWASIPDACKGPLEPSLQILEGVHARMAAFFRALPEEAWTRTAIHAERGVLSMETFLTLYSGHGEKHLQHIAAGRERFRTSK